MPIIESFPADTETVKAPTENLPCACMTGALVESDGTVVVTTTQDLTFRFKHDNGVPTIASMEVISGHSIPLPNDDGLLLALVSGLRTMDKTGMGFPYTVYVGQAQEEEAQEGAQEE